MLDFLGPRERTSRTRLALFALAGIVVAGTLAALAFGLGTWAFEYRRYSLHEGRVRRLVEKHPTIAQVRAGIMAEKGAWESYIPRPDERPGTLVAFMPLQHANEIEAKWERYPRLYLFAVGGMTYALFFDEAGRLQDSVIWATAK
jgi:hypothetical protein